MSRAVMQQALEALEKVKTDADKQPPVYPWDVWRMWVDRAITALGAALAEPEQPYDQTALDLCKVCGWRTLIPGDACLNCERSKQPEQEPVGHADLGINNIYIFSALEPRVIPVGRTPLYTAPTPRRPLTELEMPTLFVGGLALNSEATTEIVRAVEKAHGIGEQHE